MGVRDYHTVEVTHTSTYKPHRQGCLADLKSFEVQICIFHVYTRRANQSPWKFLGEVEGRWYEKYIILHFFWVGVLGRKLQKHLGSIFHGVRHFPFFGCGPLPSVYQSSSWACTSLCNPSGAWGRKAWEPLFSILICELLYFLSITLSLYLSLSLSLSHSLCPSISLFYLSLHKYTYHRNFMITNLRMFSCSGCNPITS